MDLNDYQQFSAIDPEGMLDRIQGLPDQLLTAWDTAESQDLSLKDAPGSVLIAGMGGSAIGGSLLEAFAAPNCPVPIQVHRNYGLPAWAKGPETLVVVSSHSGNTEETISALEAALENNCSTLVICTGGKLSGMGAENGLDTWIFDHDGPPRTAVGFSFCLLLNAISRLGLIQDPAGELKSAVDEMKQHSASLAPELPDFQNPAKRLAGQLVDRWVSVFGADLLAPVARRWKGQISELAKAWAQFEDLPEANHNTLAGVINPEEVLSRTTALFLVSEFNHARNQRRIELTQKNFMLEGISTDIIQARGSSRLSQIWNTLLFGDYSAYYLAMAYGVDPTPVAAIENLKREL